MFKTTVNYFFAFIIILLIAAVGDFAYFAFSPINFPTKQTEYYLRPGSSVKVLGHDFLRQGYFKHRYQIEYLDFLALITGKLSKIKTGEYIFQQDASPYQVLNQVVAGKVRYRKFTIIDGWTFKQVRRALEKNPYIVHTLDKVSDAQLMTMLGHQVESPEGMFYPDTYKFARGASDKKLLNWAYNTMQEHLSQEWADRAKGLPYKSPYQALTAASLIERETAISSERAKIAGVLVRRLQRRMRLQFDPTVIYGLGDNYNGRITKQDLKRDTPYNTYTRYGLPPTPIAMPSLAAIHAALHPAPGKALYFVATGDGSHRFSATLKEHNAAVQEYIKQKKRNKASIVNEKKLEIKATLQRARGASLGSGCIDAWYFAPDLRQLALSGQCWE